MQERAFLQQIFAQMNTLNCFDMLPISSAFSTQELRPPTPHQSVEMFMNELMKIKMMLKECIQIEVMKREILLQTNTGVKIEPVSAHQSSVKIQEHSRIIRRPPANDTKNIPKNFGKAIIAFIQKHPEITQRCLKKHNISHQSFLLQLKTKKKCLHSIKELRSLWINEEFEFARPFRELSNYFLTRSSLKYIFGSRVLDFSGHLKYRHRIKQALIYPHQFLSIKQP